MSKPNNDNTPLILILFLLIALFLYKLWLIVQPILIKFYFGNRLAIAFVLSLLSVYYLNLIARRILGWNSKRIYENKIAGDGTKNSTFMGYQDNGQKFSLNLDYRRMHMQVVGTTNAGKTESVLVPLIVDDIEKGRGLIIIDGKSDMSLLNKVYGYAVKNKRAHDFVLFSLTDYYKSQTYNPLIDESVDQVAEKIIHSFGIENEFYKTVQFDVFRNALYIFKAAREYPTFLKIKQAISDPAKLKKLAEIGKDQLLIEWASDFLNMNKDDRRNQVSGLVSNLGYFISGDVKKLFNVSDPMIKISEVMEQGKICYFQLPVLKSPMLGKSVAKMVLQDIQTQVSVRHASAKAEHNFFGVFLDDFTEYLTKPFVSVLNKSRSANVGVTFAHQAIGDLEALGTEVKNQIQTNANIKVFMRTNEPESTEFYAKAIGTKEGSKTTSRQKVGAFGKSEVTGDGSVRAVEEFIVHPNMFKRELGRGQGIVIVPHEKGAKSFLINFEMRKNVEFARIPEVIHDDVELLSVLGEENNQNKKSNETNDEKKIQSELASVLTNDTLIQTTNIQAEQKEEASEKGRSL